MLTVNMYEAKTQFSSLIKKVENEHEKILVCRNGHPIAEIIPLKKTNNKKLPAFDPKLKLNINYDPTEPLDYDELPEVCK